MTAPTGIFETNEPLLEDYLREIESGEIQLPDFQRNWVWDDEDIRSLLASVMHAYPIGAVMVLATDGQDGGSLSRLFEGVRIDPSPNAAKLVLDGQQRLTSLFLSLISSEPVPTRTERGEDVKRLYYLDMAKCLDEDEDRESAVVSVPASKLVTSDFGRKIDTDLTTRENEYKEGMFPLNLTYDSAFYGWLSGYRQHFQYNHDRCLFLDRFQEIVWHPLTQYKVPVIELGNETPKQAVCQVFRKVNTSGIPLTPFEIVTAVFAIDGFRLRNDWAAREKRLHQYHAVLEGVGGSEFLQAVTLIARFRRSQKDGSAVRVRREDVEALTLTEYTANADNVEKGFKRAARLLNQERIFDQRNLPYGGQLVPLAAVCAYLGKRFEEHSTRVKLARWYWCGVFGEMYGGASETRFGMDIQDLIAWTLHAGGEPRTVRDAEFAPMRLLSLHGRQSAAYKGLFALMVKQGSHDFISADPISDTKSFALPIDIHHIFPRAWCRRKRIDYSKWNSVINKAPLTSETNRKLGGDAPSRYLKRLVDDGRIGKDTLDWVLATHWIEPTVLRDDDFYALLRNRGIELLNAIEAAMGKPVQGRDSEVVLEEFYGPLLAD